MANVAFYIRLSREDGDKSESDSINSQRKILNQYIADQSDLIFVEEYVDDGYTGTNFNRPDFKRLLQDIENKKIDCIIVKDLSRFGRDYIDVGQYLQKIFPQNSIRFISISENIDSIKNKYDLMMPIKNIINEQYARDISEKVIGSLRAKQKNGEFIGAFTTYGYLKDPINKNKLIIDEYASIIIKRIFSMFNNGNNKLHIAKVLNEENILCPSEYKKSLGLNYTNSHKLKNTNYWTHSTIDRVLRNELYIGNMVQHKNNRSRYDFNKVGISKDEWIVIKDTHPAIIDNNTWNQTQTLLSKRTRLMDINKNIGVLAGYMICGDCGRAMSKVNRHGKTEYICGTYKRYSNKYCSQHRIPEELIENDILQYLNTVLKKLTDLKKLIDEDKSNNKQPQTNNIEKEIMKCDLEIERILKFKKSIYEDFRSELITKEEYLSYKEDYNSQEINLQNKKETLINETKNTKEEIINSQAISKLLEIGRIEKLNKTIMTYFVDKIIVFENRNLQIIFKIQNEIEQLDLM